MCCWIRVQTQPAPWSSPPEVPEAPDPLSGDAIAEIFRRGREVQEERGGTTGAELVHSELPAEQWGVSQEREWEGVRTRSAESGRGLCVQFGEHWGFSFANWYS